MKFKKITAILSSVAMLSSLMVGISASAETADSTVKTDSTVASVDYHSWQDGHHVTRYYDTLDEAVVCKINNFAQISPYSGNTVNFTIYDNCELSGSSHFYPGANATFNIDADDKDVEISTANKTSNFMFTVAGDNAKINIGTKDTQGKVTINHTKAWSTFGTKATTEITFGKNCIMKNVRTDSGVGFLGIGSAKLTIDGADVTGIKTIEAGAANIIIKGDAKIPDTGITVKSTTATIDTTEYTGEGGLVVDKTSDSQKIMPAANIVAKTTVDGVVVHHTTLMSALDAVNGKTGTVTLLQDIPAGQARHQVYTGDITINAAEGKTVTLTCNTTGGASGVGPFIIFNGTQMKFGTEGGNLILKQGTGVTWPMLCFDGSTNPIVFGPKLKIASYNYFQSGNVDLVIDGANINSLNIISAKSVTIKNDAKIDDVVIAKKEIPVTTEDGNVYAYTSKEYAVNTTYNAYNSVYKLWPKSATKSEDETSYVLDYSNITDTNLTVIAAAYDADGRMLSVAMPDAEGKCTLDFDSAKTAKIKGFVWDLNQTPQVDVYSKTFETVTE